MNIQKIFKIQNHRLNLVKLLSANVFSTILSLVFTPVFSRIFTPEDYGFNAIFSAVITLGSISIHGAYSDALIFARRRSHVPALLFISTALTLFICLLLFLCLWIYPPLLELVNLKLLVPYWYLVPLTLLSVSLTAIFGNVLTRVSDFNTKSTTVILRNLFNRLITLGWGLYLVPKFLAFVVGWLLGFGINIPLQVSRRFKEPLQRTHLNVKRVKQVLASYRRFPFYYLPSQLLLNLSSSIPILFLGYYFPKSDIGQYSFTVVLLNLPIVYLSNNIQTTFSTSLLEAYNRSAEELSRIIQKTLNFLIVFGAVPFAVLIVYGDIIFSLFLGSQWVRSGELARYLGAYYFMLMINGSIVTVLNVLKKEKIFLLINLASTLVAIASLSVGVYFGRSFGLAIGSFGIVAFLFLLGYNYYILRCAHVPLKAVLTRLGWAVLILVAVYFSRFLTEPLLNLLFP